MKRKFRIHQILKNKTDLKHIKDKYKLTLMYKQVAYFLYNREDIEIIKDVKELKWVKPIDSTYNVTGGVFYQASKLESGTYTNKYLCGVAIIQLPYFLKA